MDSDLSTRPLWDLTGYGALAQLIGGVALGVTAGMDPPTVLVIATWAFVGIGSAVMFVGLVGWGVLLGLRAHERETG